MTHRSLLIGRYSLLLATRRRSVGQMLFEKVYRYTLFKQRARNIWISQRVFYVRIEGWRLFLNVSRHLHINTRRALERRNKYHYEKKKNEFRLTKHTRQTFYHDFI